MMDLLVLMIIWFFIISVGVMTGVYFAFSVFIMRAFDELPATKAIAAMNSINVVIVKSFFLPLFLGSTVLALVLVIVSLIYLQGVAAYLGVTAGLIYLLSMFLCTVLFNVPLNNLLARFDLQHDNADSAWVSYRLNWTRWNHVRTIGSLFSGVLSSSLLALI